MADSGPRAFVVGHPIAHSRSPLIHGHWLKQYGIAGSYERIDVAPDAFSSFLASLADNGFAGGNVTLPHKEAAFAAIRNRDAAAEAIGAVNMVWIANGELLATNTDAYGFAANLDDQAAGWRAGKQACVLGAGGGARAILHALIDAGYGRIALVNRTLARAETLAQRFGSAIQPATWDRLEECLEGTDLLVNTTSLGMGASAFPEIQFDLLDRNAVVADIVYAPLRTPLLRAAAQRGFATVDGLGMLLHQAVPTFERLFGVRPSVTAELRRIIVDDLGAAA